MAYLLQAEHQRQCRVCHLVLYVLVFGIHPEGVLNIAGDSTAVGHIVEQNSRIVGHSDALRVTFDRLRFGNFCGEPPISRNLDCEKIFEPDVWGVRPLLDKHRVCAVK